MKLTNNQFIQTMKDYKAIKTVLKSANNRMTIDGSGARIDLFQGSEHVQVQRYTVTSTEESVVLGSDILNTLCKVKLEDDVEITDFISIGGRKLTFENVTQPASTVILDPYRKQFDCNASDFKKALQHVTKAVSKESSRPVLQDVLLDGNNLVALDGYRIFRRFISSKNESNFKLSIKPYVVKILLKLLPSKGDTRLNIMSDSTNYSIVFGRYVVRCSIHDVERFRYENVYPQEFKYTVLVNREELVRELEFAVATSRTIRPAVKISLAENGILKVGDIRLDADYILHPVDDDGNFVSLDIAFNPRYLLDSINGYSDDFILLQFNEALKPIVIGNRDLILPIRLNS